MKKLATWMLAIGIGLASIGCGGGGDDGDDPNKNDALPKTGHDADEQKKN